MASPVSISHTYASDTATWFSYWTIGDRVFVKRSLYFEINNFRFQEKHLVASVQPGSSLTERRIPKPDQCFVVEDER